jgi:hypothetical protein
MRFGAGFDQSATGSHSQFNEINGLQGSRWGSIVDQYSQSRRARLSSQHRSKLGDIFATERRDNIDLSGVAVIDPALSPLPQIEPNGMCGWAGSFLGCEAGQF